MIKQNWNIAVTASNNTALGLIQLKKALKGQELTKEQQEMVRDDVEMLKTQLTAVSNMVYWHNA